MSKYTKWDDGSEGLTLSNTTAVDHAPGDIWTVGTLHLVAHEHTPAGEEGFYFCLSPRRGWMVRVTTPLVAALAVGALFDDPDVAGTANIGTVVKPAAVGDTCVWILANEV